MKETIEITSAQNPRIKFLVKLRDRRTRETERKMLVEGYREVTRALECGMKFTEFFYSESFFLGQNEQTVIQKITLSGTEMFSVSEAIFPKICYRDRPEGLVGVLPFFDTALSNLKVTEIPNPLYLVVESIEKPGNLGTMLRTADAVGVSGLIVCNRCTDIFNPNVLRASTGTIFSVPLAEATTDETIEWLQKNHVKTIAADPYAKTIYYKQNFLGPIAIILGAEQFGLSEKWKNKSDYLVSIPMSGLADSLNVAQAGTILLFEVKRQIDLSLEKN